MMTTHEQRAEQQARNERFIRNLRRLMPTDDEQRDNWEESRNRAILAQLRRGLGKEPGSVPDMFSHVEYIFPVDLPSEDEDPYYLVAALFAWHQKDWPSNDTYRSNLGASLAELRWKQTADRGETVLEQGDSTERRVVALLNSTRADLPYHLRQMIGLLRTKEVRVNWLQLLADIQDWDTGWRNNRGHSVQQRWASAFWSQTALEQPTDTTSTSTTSGEDQLTDDY